MAATCRAQGLNLNAEYPARHDPGPVVTAWSPTTPKIGIWSTFKNRPDYECDMPPADPANVNSQAVRIESIPGTGSSRGIVFVKESLHSSIDQARPVAIDFSEIEDTDGIDMKRFSDGCSVRYMGHGVMTTLCPK